MLFAKKGFEEHDYTVCSVENLSGDFTTLNEDDDVHPDILWLVTSDRDSESSDDSDDREYIEECLRLTKRSKRVGFSDTIKHDPYRSQETPISLTDTFDNESQGTAKVTSDIYKSKEIKIHRVLRLKTVGPKILYNLTLY
jgi:hypothetical protein